MRTIEVKVFSFDELGEQAKKKAINDHRESVEYGWSDENRKSLEKFADIFNLRGLSWSYGGGGGSWVTASFESWSEGRENLSGRRLIAELWNVGKNTIWTPKYLKHGEIRDERPPYHPMRKVSEITGGPNKGKFSISYYSRIQKEADCPFTGVCSDYYLIKPIEEYLKNPDPNKTYKELIKYCLDSWAESCGEDYDYTFSDEYVQEELENNEYEFTEDGSKF
jgi:hypothetical protein